MKHGPHRGHPGHGENANFLCILCVLCVLCVRDVRANNVSLPLKGYFHPGRAMPVRWDISSGELVGRNHSSIRIGRDRRSRAMDRQSAWSFSLARDRSQRPRCPLAVAGRFRGDFPSLHPLEDSDWLVASSLDDDSAAARAVSPGGIRLSFMLPSGIEGPAMAWETLDAILLTPDALAKTFVARPSRSVCRRR